MWRTCIYLVWAHSVPALVLNRRGFLQEDPEENDTLKVAGSLQRMAFPSLEAYLNALPQANMSSRLVKDIRGCAGAPEEGESARVFLMTVVDAFHGSTALARTLMGSKSLASLCAADAWDCEGHELVQHRTPDKFSILKLYGEHWDLSKPVLFDKSPGMMKATPHFYETQLRGHTGGNGTLPWLYRAHGIRQLNLAFVAMWRPICMVQLSRRAPAAPSYDFAVAEVEKLRVLVVDISWMQDMSLPFLVVSYGRLLWRPDETQRRLQAFLPCLPGVSVDSVPMQNVDVSFEGNIISSGESVREFGLRHDPRALGYDVDTNRCHGDWSYSRMLQDDPDLYSETAEYQFFLEGLSL